MKALFIKNFYDRYLGNILIASLLFYLISSSLHNIISYFYHKNFILPFTSFFKLGFLVFFLGIMIINYKYKKKLFLYLGTLLIVFVVANLKWPLRANLDENLYKSFTEGNLFYCIKYFYPFIFLGAFSLIKNKEETINNYFEILEKFLIINAFFVFLGFLCTIDFLQSYPNTDRFGYSGLIERYFYIYFSIIIISRRFFLNKIDFTFFILSFASLLSGTKGMILFFAVLILYDLYKKRNIKLLLLGSGILVIGLFYIKAIITFLIKIFPFWKPILVKYGYMTLLFSTRDLLLQNTLHYLSIEKSFNYLFVGGIEFVKYSIQMDFIDLFLFFGFIGGIIYVVLLSKIVNKSYHLIPLILAFFEGSLLVGTILMCTYLLWLYESDFKNNELF